MAKSKGRRPGGQRATPPAKAPQGLKASTGARATQGAKRTAEPAAPMALSERIVWVCLHLLVFLVPLAVSNPSIIGIRVAPFTYDQFDIVKVVVMRALVLVAGAAWAAGILTRGGRIRTSRVEWLVLVVLAWLLVTTVLSVHPATAVFGKYRRFEGLISFMTYMGAFFLALQVVDRPSRIRSLARTLVASGVLVSLYGVVQYLGLDPGTWGRLPFEVNRAFSTYGNPDLLGGYLIFPLAISLGLALSEDDQRWRSAYWAAFAVVAFCWLVAFVRGAWIGGAVALVALVVALVRSKTRLTSVDWSFTGASAALLGLATVRSLTSTDGVTNVVTRITSIFQFNEGSALTRFQIWQAALDAIKERPVFGWGLDTFRLLFPRFKPLAYTSTAGFISVADNVHNYPLQLATAIGIPGVLMLYGLFGWSLVNSAKHVFRDGGGSGRLVLAGFWAATLGYIVHLVFGLSVTGSTVFLWIAMGVLLSPGATVHEVKAPSGGFVPAAIVVAICVVLFAGNAVYLAADHAYLNAEVLSSGADTVTYSKRAVELNPFNDMYRAGVGLAWQRQFELAAASGNSQMATMYYREAEKEYRAVIDWAPMEYDNYVFLANLYNQAAYVWREASYVEKAIEVARAGMAVEPYGPAIRLQMATALHTLRQYDEALEVAAEAIAMDQNYPDLWALLGDINVALGRIADARYAYGRALALEPDRPDALEALKNLEASISPTPTATP